MSPFRIVAIRPVYEGWGRFMTARVTLPDGQLADRQIEDHGTSVCVLAYDPGRRVALLVRQPRTAALYAVGVPDMLEAIAGRLEGDAPADEARREVREEGGLELGPLGHVVTGWAAPEVSAERGGPHPACYH